MKIFDQLTISQPLTITKNIECFLVILPPIFSIEIDQCDEYEEN